MKITFTINVERAKAAETPAPIAPVNQAQNAVPAAPTCELPGQPALGAPWPHSGNHGHPYDEDAPYL